MQKAISLKSAIQHSLVVVIFIVLSVGLATAQSPPAWVLSGWNKVEVDPDPLVGTFRRQIADISSLGGRRFVAAYIVEDNADGSTETGELRYARFDVATGFSSVPIRGAGRADWVRAVTGGPLLQGACTPEVLAAHLHQSEVAWGNPNYVTFFSYGFTSGDERRVGLVRYAWCGGRAMATHHDVGDGEVPSIAAGQSAGETKLLVAYGKENGLFGRFFDSAGTALGTEFGIAAFPAGFGVRSTDIIWNSVSQRFIVGFVRSGGIKLGCTVHNVRLTWEGNAEVPVMRGDCDADVGGHHTSVAYDSRALANPDGVYAWWYQGGSAQKALRLMDAYGNPTGIEADLLQNSWTQPVAARREKSNFHMTFGLVEGSYVTASGISSMKGWTFSRGGSSQTFGFVAPDANIVAVEALDTISVFLFRDVAKCLADAPPLCDLGTPWAISVVSHFRTPLLAE